MIEAEGGAVRIGVIGLGKIGGAAAGLGERDWGDLVEWVEQRARCHLALAERGQ